MKCPNCEFAGGAELFGSPAACPECGAFYEKSLQAKIRREEAAAEVEGIRRTSKLARGLAGAADGVAEARKSRKSGALYDSEGNQVVVVNSDSQKGGCLKVILMAVGFIVFLAVVRGCVDGYERYNGVGAHSPAQVARKAKRSEDDLEFNRQYQAKKMVEEILKDPFSAKFRNQKGMCGEVNSKNAFGAYTGYKRFMATTLGVIFEGDPALADGAFDEAWDRGCIKAVTQAKASSPPTSPQKTETASQGKKPAEIEKPFVPPTISELRSIAAPMEPDKGELILGFQPKLTVVRWSAESSAWRMAELSQGYNKSGVSKAIAITDCKGVYGWLNSLSLLDFLNKNFPDKFEFVDYKESDFHTRVRDHICE